MLKILTPLHTTPDVKSYRTLCFGNLLPVLKRKTDIHISWLVYKPERVNRLSQDADSENTILDIHDFRNALEVVQKVKPDIIWAAPTLNLPDYALSQAGKFCRIPVVGELVNELFIKSSIVEAVRSHTMALFDSSVPTDTTSNKKKFMKRGRFFIYKYFFLLRTQRAIGMGWKKIVKNFLMLFKVHLLILKRLNYPEFACNLHFVESEKLKDSLTSIGFDRSTLVVTGNPIYDSDFRKMQNLHLKPKDGKIHILLLTHAMYEHGVWTRKQRDLLVEGIVKEINKYKDEMSLVVKIHPSSEILSEYQSIVNSIDSSIPIHQKGDVIEFIAEADVIISYSTASALINALVLKKPIIICNLYNLEGDLFLEKGLVLECNNLSNLVPLIRQSSSVNPATQHKIDSFIEDLLYKFDGRASERIADAMLELIAKNKTGLQ